MPDNSTPETGERTPVIVWTVGGETWVNVSSLREYLSNQRTVHQAKYEPISMFTLEDGFNFGGDHALLKLQDWLQEHGA